MDEVIFLMLFILGVILSDPISLFKGKESDLYNIKRGEIMNFLYEAPNDGKIPYLEFYTYRNSGDVLSLYVYASTWNKSPSSESNEWRYIQEDESSFNFRMEKIGDGSTKFYVSVIADCKFLCTEEIMKFHITPHSSSLTTNLFRFTNGYVPTIAFAGTCIFSCCFAIWLVLTSLICVLVVSVFGVFIFFVCQLLGLGIIFELLGKCCVACLTS